jgi:hypothetical protein
MSLIVPFAMPSKIESKAEKSIPVSLAALLKFFKIYTLSLKLSLFFNLEETLDSNPY